MTQSTTMHMFTQPQQSTPTLFVTCLHQRLNNNSMYDNSRTTYMHITYINTNNIILIQQLQIILTIQLMEKIHHIMTIIIFNHQTIIHTTLYIHIKPFMKEFQSKRVQ